MKPARIQRRPLMQTTSREAFRERPLGHLDAQIVGYISLHGGATDWEIERDLGLRHQSVSANRRHLVERGKVHASDERRATPSGRAAIVWALGPGPHVPAFTPPNGPTEQMSLAGIR